MALSVSGAIMLSLVLIGCIVLFMTNRKQRPPQTKPKSKGKTKKTCAPKSKECAYTTRIFVDGVWGCPLGYEENGCDWKDGPEKGKLQCRACGPDNPYIAYQETNTNCPAGFKPCNQAPFNYGDLKKNAKGEYYYDKGWGVEDPNYNETDGLNPYGGTITLNRGHWGGTDAHPELFAKGCCAWGNSVDDPERDSANKKIKIATFIGSSVLDAAGVVAGFFTGGIATAAMFSLHGASGGLSFSSIRSKCGGPTEVYKKTKRNYMFKGPYKDGFKMRGTPGIWYTANDGCPMKWLQYIPPNQRETTPPAS